MHFWHTFWLSLYIADNHRFPREYYGLMIKYTKSHHPNWCIKVGNTPPRLPCCWVIPSFFCNETWQGQSVMLDLKLLLLKNFTTPFYGWGSTVSRLQKTLRGDSLLFTTRALGLPGTHLVSLGRIHHLVNLGASQWFWAWDPWIGNAAP